MGLDDAVNDLGLRYPLGLEKVIFLRHRHLAYIIAGDLAVRIEDGIPEALEIYGERVSVLIILVYNEDVYLLVLFIISTGAVNEVNAFLARIL